jgi:hypothetical protein
MPAGLFGEGIAAKGERQNQVRSSLPVTAGRVTVFYPTDLNMGILTRKQGETFVITSDQNVLEPQSKRPPRRLDEPYQVWTGANWSINNDEAMTFDSMDEADEYVRANYGKVSA